MEYNSITWGTRQTTVLHHVWWFLVVILSIAIEHSFGLPVITSMILALFLAEVSSAWAVSISLLFGVLLAVAYQVPLWAGVLACVSVEFFFVYGSATIRHTPRRVLFTSLTTAGLIGIFSVDRLTPQAWIYSGLMVVLVSGVSYLYDEKMRSGRSRKLRV